MAAHRGGSQTRGQAAEDKNDEAAAAGQGELDNPSSTPGSGDTAAAVTSNPSAEQVTVQDGEPREAEGQRIRDKARDEADHRDVVTLDTVITTSDPSALKYDDSGVLVNKDGKRVALAADAQDPDVGWTVQHAGAHVDEGDRRSYPGGPASVPDQTFHPDELPDPVAAMRAGLLPQNVAVLNIDEDKFKGKKSLEA